MAGGYTPVAHPAILEVLGRTERTMKRRWIRPEESQVATQPSNGDRLEPISAIPEIVGAALDALYEGSAHEASRRVATQASNGVRFVRISPISEIARAAIAVSDKGSADAAAIVVHLVEKYGLRITRSLLVDAVPELQAIIQALDPYRFGSDGGPDEKRPRVFSLGASPSQDAPPRRSQRPLRPLTERETDILRFLYDKGYTYQSENRTTRVDIAKGIRWGMLATSMSREFRELRKREYIDASRAGPRGKTFLTALGVAVAAALPPA